MFNKIYVPSERNGWNDDAYICMFQFGWPVAFRDQPGGQRGGGQQGVHQFGRGRLPRRLQHHRRSTDHVQVSKTILSIKAFKHTDYCYECTNQTVRGIATLNWLNIFHRSIETICDNLNTFPVSIFGCRKNWNRWISPIAFRLAIHCWNFQQTNLFLSKYWWAMKNGSSSIMLCEKSHRNKTVSHRKQPQTRNWI